jgi:hypothetical protein
MGCGTSKKKPSNPPGGGAAVQPMRLASEAAPAAADPKPAPEQPDAELERRASDETSPRTPSQGKRRCVSKA